MARRKIYDIKPPKVAQQKEEKKPRVKRTVRATVQKPKPAPAVAAVSMPTFEPKRRRSGEKSMWLPISAGVLVVLLLIGGFLFFKLPKAEVSIWPRVETLSYKQVVTADKSANSVDSAKFIIPAQYFEASKTLSQDFPATGNADNTGKATGTITVYNKSNIGSLRAGTHFMSDSGKLFVAPQKIILPAPKKSGGKLIPGSVKVAVEAAEGGASYNIAPANFSVPGLKGTAEYYNIYATSQEAMAGGFESKVKKVTDDDIQGAKDVLTKTVSDQAVAEVKSKIPAEYVLLDSAVSFLVTDASTQTKAGTVAEKFSYAVAVKASAVAFKKSDLDQFAKDYLASQMPQGNTLLDGSYKIEYSAGLADISGGKILVNTEFSGGNYKAVDKNSLTASFVGKDANQISQIVSQEMGEQVSQVKVKLWPFWVAKAPNSQKAVKVELKFQ